MSSYLFEQDVDYFHRTMEYHLVNIENHNLKHHDNIDYILEILYPKYNPNFKLIAYGNDVNPAQEYYIWEFIEFIAPSDLINMENTLFMFNEIYYELHDEVLQKVINNLHALYIMEEITDEDEMVAYKYITEHGPATCKKVNFNGKKK